MLPLRLELKNFLPYMSPDPVRFEGIHLACLVGPNGAGKSSLLDAITWALWGSGRAKRDEDLIYVGQQDMYVQLDFEQEGQIYRVIRKREKRGRSGVGSLDLLVKDADDQFVVISEPNMRATQEKIDRLLRLDYETFCNSAFLQQGKADAFTTKTPKERKQILSDILGLAQWEQFKSAAKEHQNTILKQLEEDEGRIRDIDTELAREPEFKGRLEQAIKSEKTARTALEAAEKRLAEVASAPIEMRNRQVWLSEQERVTQEHERDVQAVEAEIARYRTRITAFEQVIGRRDDIEAGYAALQAAREADFDLGDKLRRLKELDEKQHQHEMQLQKVRSQLEQKITGIKERISGLERTVNQSDAQALEAVQGEISALHGLEVQRSELQDQIRLLGEQRGEIEATNKGLRDEMHKIKDRLDRLNSAVDATCPLCGQPLDEQHRQEIIEEISADGKQRGDLFRANETRMKGIAADLVAFPKQVVELEVQLKQMTALNERAGALQAQIDAALSAETTLKEESLQLEQLQRTLDTDEYGRDVRAQIAKLAKERAEIGYDDSSHHAAREQLQQYREYEMEQSRLNAAQTELPVVQLDMDEACQRLEQKEHAVEEDHQRTETLKTEIAQLAAEVEEYNLRQNEANTMREAEQNARDERITAQQELKALDDQRTRKTALETRAQASRAEASIYRELTLAFGKNGIPAMIIETAIPELEIAANDLLSRMTSGRMNLAFHTQREKITGGMAETLEIQIADEIGTRSYEMYSGGEAFRINFAIRVALSQMLARRAGAHLRTLFIDEGFGTQDEEGRNRLVEAITAIQDDFDLILVITHIDELRDSFPVHIMVEKTANGSQVSVR